MTRALLTELAAFALMAVLAVVVAIDLYVIWNPSLAGSAS